MKCEFYSYNQGEQSFTYVTLCVLPESARLFEVSRQNGRIGPKKYVKVFTVFTRLKIWEEWPKVLDMAVKFRIG